MYEYCVFALLAVVLTAADKADEIIKCVEFLDSDLQCCKSCPLSKNSADLDIYKECMLIPRSPGSCERAMCFSTKKGYVTDDGTLKMDVLIKDLETRFADNKDTLDAIKEKCIDGDFTIYGEADDCDAAKMANCIHWQAKFKCTDFKDDGPCKGSKDMAKKCLELDS